MNKIAELRKSRGLSQLALGRQVGAAQNSVSNWENGAREPDNATLLKLASFFDVTVDYLLGRTNYRDLSAAKPDDVALDEIEYALHGEIRELGDAEKAALLDYARRMRRLLEYEREHGATGPRGYGDDPV